MTPSILTDEDARDVTHIWISHEHPDHFSPESLRYVLERASAPPTVLFQRTNDHRVVDWCHNAGFPVYEVDEGAWTTIGDEVNVVLGKCGLYDSWLAMRAGSSVVLDLNDCVLFEPRDVARVARQIGPIDCLVTQFSYANWIGNPSDTELRAAEARRRVERIIPQITELAPQHVIPAASFVWFSHEENAYLNDFAVPVRTAADVIENAGATPVVLTPGDEWILGSSHDNKRSVAFYENLNHAEGQQLHHATTVTFETLEMLASAYVNRISSANSRVLIRVALSVRWLRDIKIFLWDHQRSVRFHPTEGLSSLDTSEASCDVSMGSDSLAFILRFNWGVDTLSVNGRFRSRTSTIAPIYRAFRLGVLNNAGHALALRESIDRSAWTLLTSKVGRRMRRLVPHRKE